MAYTIQNDPPTIANDCYRNGGPQSRLNYYVVNYGPVTIHTQSLLPAVPPGVFQPGPRPVSVSGIVIPLGAVGHHANPNPSGGWVTVGEPGIDKGHIFALELGGPNIEANVVPQWAHWQQFGAWRYYERDINILAQSLTQPLANKNQIWLGLNQPIPLPAATYIKYEVTLQYKTLLHLEIAPSITAWAFPIAWYMTAFPCDIGGVQHGPDILRNYFVPRPFPNYWSVA